MLTGDNRATAEAIGEADRHRRGLRGTSARRQGRRRRRPGSAVMARSRWLATESTTLLPRGRRANLGIAMGAMGSDAAIETADVALMSDDLSRLPWLVRHSRATLAVIRQNIAFSIAVKLLFTVLTVIGLASLWGAIAADVGASCWSFSTVAAPQSGTAPDRWWPSRRRKVRTDERAHSAAARPAPAH